ARGRPHARRGRSRSSPRSASAVRSVPGARRPRVRAPPRYARPVGARVAVLAATRSATLAKHPTGEDDHAGKGAGPRLWARLTATALLVRGREIEARAVRAVFAAQVVWRGFGQPRERRVGHAVEASVAAGARPARRNPREALLAGRQLHEGGAARITLAGVP